MFLVRLSPMASFTDPMAIDNEINVKIKDQSRLDNDSSHVKPDATPYHHEMTISLGRLTVIRWRSLVGITTFQTLYRDGWIL